MESTAPRPLPGLDFSESSDDEGFDPSTSVLVEKRIAGRASHVEEMETSLLPILNYDPENGYSYCTPLCRIPKGQPGTFQINVNRVIINGRIEWQGSPAFNQVLNGGVSLISPSVFIALVYDSGTANKQLVTLDPTAVFDMQYLETVIPAVYDPPIEPGRYQVLWHRAFNPKEKPEDTYKAGSIFNPGAPTANHNVAWCYRHKDINLSLDVDCPTWFYFPLTEDTRLIPCQGQLFLYHWTMFGQCQPVETFRQTVFLDATAKIVYDIAEQ